MKRLNILLVALALISLSSCDSKTDSRFMQKFTENFDKAKPQFFDMGGSHQRYYSGVHSFTEEKTDVMLLTIRPTDQ